MSKVTLAFTNYERAVSKAPSTIQRGSLEHPAQVMAFNILAFNGPDIRAETLVARKKILGKVLGRTKRRISFVDFVEQEGEVLFGVTEQLHLEGVMAKRCDSIYRAGKSRHWLKIKTPSGKAREAKRFEH